MAAVVRRCEETETPLTVVGAGSNTLVLDGGIRGLVVRLGNKRWSRVDATTVEAGAGMMMPRLALDLAKEGIAGMEFGIGVPGTCGASVRGNAGAFGTEIKDVLVSCRCLGPDGAHEHTVQECAFSYRNSSYKRGDFAGHLVWSARFTVHDDDAARTRQRTDEIQSARKASQPYGERSLGSVFTNPSGDHAGRLIEAAGLKGLASGGAAISTKHANFIINVSNATADDVLTLVTRAHDAVLEKFGVDLEPEIVVLGETGEGGSHG
jgi:UDP-N-acetylmuramate dehydrogenase